MRQIIYCFIYFLFVPIKLLGDDVLSIFQNRMKKIDNFHAHFVQKISSIDGNLIESGCGELWIKKPNLFHYHMFSPEENFLISDGKTLWFYVPIIKQVTAYCLQNSIYNNVILKLLFDFSSSEDKEYNVTQKKNWFYLQPTVYNSYNLKECKIKITDQGVMDHFIIIESNGQCIDYCLSIKHDKCIDINKFSFIVSENIQLDDQR